MTQAALLQHRSDGALASGEMAGDASTAHSARAPLPRFVKDLFGYGLVSLVALACDYGLLIALTREGLHYLPAAALSFSVGIAVAYALSVRFVFADRRAGSKWREALGFAGVGIAGLLLTQGLLLLFVSGLSLDVAVAKIPTTACVFVFNFLVRRGWIFGAAVP